MYSLEYKSCLTEQRNRKEIETTHQNWSRPATHNYTRQTVCFIRKNVNTSIINNIVRLQKQQVYYFLGNLSIWMCQILNIEYLCRSRSWIYISQILQLGLITTRVHDFDRILVKKSAGFICAGYVSTFNSN